MYPPAPVVRGPPPLDEEGEPGAVGVLDRAEVECQGRAFPLVRRDRRTGGRPHALDGVEGEAARDPHRPVCGDLD